MVFVRSAAARRLLLTISAALLLIGQVVTVVQAQAGPATIPVVGCQGAASPLDTDDETSDDSEAASGDSDQVPAIVGSVAAPAGAKESDKRLGSLATISAAQARDAALAAVSDADQRQVRSVGLEVEQGYVIYAVKTVRRTPGADPKLEVKVDAGNGAVLLMECDPNDN